VKAYLKKYSMKNPSEHFSDSLFLESEILPTVKFSVVIPVKDEESYITRTLKSFSEQVDLSGNALDFEKFEVLVLANNCTDYSVEFIKNFQAQHPAINIYLEEITLSPKNSNIGYVRRKLMECANSRLRKNDGGIILTTDGDTVVSPDWIAQTEYEIDNGAEAVGGRILLSENELAGLDECTLLHHLKDEKYHLLIADLEGQIMNSNVDPSPRHHQHFNGSFAITTDCYTKSGGVPAVEHLEDCAFFEKLESIDAKIRHSHRVFVHTSARCVGRAAVGLSYQLNVWKNLGNTNEKYFVESCDSIFERLNQKRSMMTLWESEHLSSEEFHYRIKKIIPEIKEDEEIYNSFVSAHYFGDWFQKVIKLKQLSTKERFPAVHIDTAILDLQFRLQKDKNQNFPQISVL
jgi:glycosyltransferase involved in cell wall biosynthesis